jgi:hypothetical protein
MAAFAGLTAVAPFGALASLAEARRLRERAKAEALRHFHPTHNRRLNDRSAPSSLRLASA